MRIYVDFDEHSEDGQYFLTCARIRDISGRSLLRRLFAVLSEDKLVASVLDDSDCLRSRRTGEHGYKGPVALRATP